MRLRQPNDEWCCYIDNKCGPCVEEVTFFVVADEYWDFCTYHMFEMMEYFGPTNIDVFTVDGEHLFHAGF